MIFDLLGDAVLVLLLGLFAAYLASLAHNFIVERIGTPSVRRAAIAAGIVTAVAGVGVFAWLPGHLRLMHERRARYNMCVDLVSRTIGPAAEPVIDMQGLRDLADSIQNNDPDLAADMRASANHIETDSQPADPSEAQIQLTIHHALVADYRCRPILSGGILRQSGPPPNEGLR